jgi:hypothetical protein
MFTPLLNDCSLESRMQPHDATITALLNDYCLESRLQLHNTTYTLLLNDCWSPVG